MRVRLPSRAYYLVFQFHFMDSECKAPRGMAKLWPLFQFHFMDSSKAWVQRHTDRLHTFQFHFMDSSLPPVRLGCELVIFQFHFMDSLPEMLCDSLGHARSLSIPFYGFGGVKPPKPPPASLSNLSIPFYGFADTSNERDAAWEFLLSIPFYGFIPLR